MPKKITAKKVETEFHAGNRTRRKLKVATTDFMEKNNDNIVIVADVKTDVIAVGYKGVFSAMNFRAEGTGKKLHVIANFIEDLKKGGAKTDRSIDQFLLAIDAGLFQIGVKLREEAEAKKKILKANRK